MAGTKKDWSFFHTLENAQKQALKKNYSPIRFLGYIFSTEKVLK